MKLLFRIIQVKSEPIELSLEQMRKFPVHEHFLSKGSELLLLYTFKPTSNLNIDEYKVFLCEFFKRKYNAYSVTVGEPEKELK
jgi:hypothetical protein